MKGAGEDSRPPPRNPLLSSATLGGVVSWTHGDGRDKPGLAATLVGAGEDSRPPRGTPSYS